MGNYLPHGICGSLGIFSPLSIGKLMINNKILIFKNLILNFQFLLVYSTPSVDSDSVVSLTMNKKFLDIIGIIFIIHPYIIFIPIVLLSGYYSDINDLENARLYFKAHYICWTVFAILYIALLSYLYYRLIYVINYQIKNIKHYYDDDNSNNSDLNTWKRAKRNVSINIKYIFIYFFGGFFFI